MKTTFPSTNNVITCPRGLTPDDWIHIGHGYGKGATRAADALRKAIESLPQGMVSLKQAQYVATTFFFPLGEVEKMDTRSILAALSEHGDNIQKMSFEVLENPILQEHSMQIMLCATSFRF